MGKDGGGGGTQTVVNKTELPQWVQDAGKKNLAAAYQVSDNLMAPYDGPRVAGMTNGQQAAIGALQNNIGSTNPAFAYAQNTAAGLTGYNPSQVNPGSLAGTDLSAYMNPYTQNVINSGMQAIDTQRRNALNQLGDQAIRSGAFGGSRLGVQEGVTNASAAAQAGNLAAQLMGQNFSQAQNAAQGDIMRNLQAQQMNQAAGLQGAGLNLTAANALGSLADQGQRSFLQGTTASLAGQEAIQQQAQKELMARQQAYLEAQQFPLQQLQIPLMALGATPYGQTNTQTGPGPTSNPLMQGLGAASSLVGTIGGLMAIFSDEREKTNVQKVGKDPASGLPLYAYDYKADVENARRSGAPMPPKRVGPMAQDIERKAPDAVRSVGGKKVVNLGFGPMRRG